MKLAWAKILSWIVAILVPLVLVMAAVRLVMFPWFLSFEYNTPGFPDDPYGFTYAERIRYSRIALDYLLNKYSIDFIRDLRFPEGQEAPPASCKFMDDCTRLYNDRELKHMIDAMVALQTALKVWYLLLLVTALLAIIAWRTGWLPVYFIGLKRGGWLTVGLIAILLVLILAAFGTFFVAFHGIFFDPGTWIFLTSDTFIRLFPERFWRDVFVVVGTLACGMGLTLSLTLRRWISPVTSP